MNTLLLAGVLIAWICIIIITFAVLLVFTIFQFILKKKKRIKSLSFAIAITILILISSLISYKMFNAVNIISSGINIARISFTSDVDFIEIQHSPKIVLAKPDFHFENYCTAQGYTYLPNEQEGSIATIEKGGVKEHVIIHIHAYYLEFCWMEP